MDIHQKMLGIEKHNESEAGDLHFKRTARTLTMK